MGVKPEYQQQQHREHPSSFKTTTLPGEQEQRVSHNIEISGGDLGIQILNNKFFDQKSIEKWGVFYQDRDSIAAKTFVAMMEKVLQK